MVQKSRKYRIYYIKCSKRYALKSCYINCYILNGNIEDEEQQPKSMLTYLKNYNNCEKSAI